MCVCVCVSTDYRGVQARAAFYMLEEGFASRDGFWILETEVSTLVYVCEIV